MAIGGAEISCESGWIFFRNICTNKKTECLCKNISYTRDRHGHNTRHTAMGRFTVPKPRTEAMKKYSHVQGNDFLELSASMHNRNKG